jgi:hypothetical protein
MDLFDLKIPILNKNAKQSEFEKIQKDFSEYDPSYVFNASAIERRECISIPYIKCKDFLDDNFCLEIRKPGKFIDRLWELQVCLVLISNGHKIIKRVSARNYARPDFCVKGKNGGNIWIEAVCAGADDSGIMPSKPELNSGMMYSSSRLIANTLKSSGPRITTGIGHKYLEKLPKYKNNPEFNEKADKFIIALNTYNIDHEQTGSMSEELVLYGMGLQWIRQSGESGRYFHWSVEKKKKDGSIVEVEVALFHRPEYSDLSAVITSDLWFDFGTDYDKNMSNKLNLYFNHRAKNPLNIDEFNFGKRSYMICEGDFCELKTLQC